MPRRLRQFVCFSVCKNDSSKSSQQIFPKNQQMVSIWYNLRPESDPVYGMICISAIVCVIVKMQNIPLCRCRRTENWC